MPNGKPGDHPLTDILLHNHKVYGDEIDSLIRRIYELNGYEELDKIEWFQKQNKKQLKANLDGILKKIIENQK